MCIGQSLSFLGLVPCVVLPTGQRFENVAMRLEIGAIGQLGDTAWKAGRRMYCRKQGFG
jgi:hypothetical protein